MELRGIVIKNLFMVGDRQQPTAQRCPFSELQLAQRRILFSRF
jgi:hypothetical protein